MTPDISNFNTVQYNSILKVVQVPIRKWFPSIWKVRNNIILFSWEVGERGERQTDTVIPVLIP